MWLSKLSRLNGCLNICNYQDDYNFGIAIKHLPILESTAALIATITLYHMHQKLIGLHSMVDLDEWVLQILCSATGVL